MIKAAEAGWEHDPLVVVGTLVALVLVMWAITLRRGGANAALIIEVFAFLATIVSGLKMMAWIPMRIANMPGEPPTGTDLLLVFGAFVAVVFVSVQGLSKSLQGESRNSSALGHWLEGYTWPTRLPRPVRSLLGVDGVPIAGVDDQKTSPGDPPPS